ncbi:primosomal protein N' [Candidatus Poribacteria bacterium]|nr:primosomal protein N' [Candidatus Poribacteria bacterium]MYA58667.1 primosomal protein N' [Candidatus Poribacteria bacterium]
MRYANIAFPLSVDQVFTYGVPPQLDAVLQPGTRVLAPFRGTRQEGVVVERLNETDLAPGIIKNISTCLEKTPTFSTELLALTKWMAEYYVCSWGLALFCAVPAAVRTQKEQKVQLLPDAPTPRGKVQKQLVALLAAEGELSLNQLARRMGISYQKLRPKITVLQEKGIVSLDVTHKPKANTQLTSVATLALPSTDIEAEIDRLKGEADGSENPAGSRPGNRRHIAAAKHAEILRHLLDAGAPLATADLTKRVNSSISLLRTLERRGFLDITRAQAVRNPLSSEPIATTQPLHLNSAQSIAFTELQNILTSDTAGGVCNPDVPHAPAVERAPTFLLHGVTGSGKTEVYMQAMTEVLSNGKSVIALVPEISLTPQAASRFVGRFGERVALLHSRLSDGERYDQWHRIRNGDADIVIGPRSAVFAPVKELGMLIIDEEHSDSYKSDIVPRYHARDVARKRGELANCPVILGSATPSLESFHRAKNGRYRLLSLPDRVLNRKMPDVHIADMRTELKKGNRTIFSDVLRNSIEERLERQEQIILFLNRRGHSTYVFCRTCGYVERCENCSISLTFHFETKRLVCHHCGNKRPTHPSCPQCGSPAIRYFGLGTEAVEQEVRKAFPEARVKRFDADSTTRKNAHQQILETFEQQQIDILIGTQMVSKGLDFPNVTLVGVIAADTSLNLPDFRASEQTFSLLTQVAGRSGRADLEGKVIIQTYMPEHYCISAAQKHDYLGFYAQEVEARGALQYPPFSHVGTLLLRGKDEKQIEEAAHAVEAHLQTWLTDQASTAQADETEGDVGGSEVEILGPAPAPLSKIEGKFRWHFLLRSNSVESISQLLKHLTDEPPVAIKSNAIEFVIDIDPTSIL